MLAGAWLFWGIVHSRSLFLACLNSLNSKLQSESNGNAECRMDSDEDETFTYEGGVDEKGKHHGSGRLIFEGGNEFDGNFCHGLKNGPGTFHFADGSCLDGIYKDDNLVGEATYKYDDGSSIKNMYEDGELNGPSLEYDSQNKLTFRGQHFQDVRSGLCWFYFSDGGLMCGVVKEMGELSGNNIMYVYPDRRTAFIGTFDEGELVKCYAAEVSFHEDVTQQTTLPEIVRTDKENEYRLDISMDKLLSKYPLLTDPYEDKLVYVAKSTIENAGEGLFVKQTVEKGTVVAFYNGVRLTHKQVDDRDWSCNDNTISLDDVSVIDVPKEYVSTEAYRASLGHKVNHSFDPNSKYDLYQHPRFGSIKCIRTIKPVAEGSEVTVHYTYEHNFHDDKGEAEAPAWYRQQLKKFGRENAAMVLETLNNFDEES